MLTSGDRKNGQILRTSAAAGRLLAGKGRWTATLTCLESRSTDLDSRRESTEEKGALKGRKEGEEGTAVEP